ncbi:hypothetical protein [Acanthopleuribacter pedis]|uniref:Uncharacterized protein n=1 Tax=Acanthopleuribacter pedis TaxID=442870 RepID=A0A8J7U170_9BACT|nr:hypothetical protein [Acanthopleuribacter pedis]MBO1317853.1 hypothetical protein [Acanthopleuribacter pedis]
MLNNRVSFWFPLLLSGLFFQPLQADIELRTTVRDVFIRDVCALTGRIGFSVTSDDFADASPANPHYIRLRLDHGALTCRDIVNPSKNLDPILIPMEVDAPGYTINADPTAVQIVRWRAGEPEIWLRVSESSSRWLMFNETPVPPSPSGRVNFDLGLDIQGYVNVYQTEFTLGRASLPFPTRDLNRSDIPSSPPVGTLIEVDLSQSNLEAIEVIGRPEETTLNIDPIVFDSQTNGVETSADYFAIQLGQLTSVAFSDERIIGRGTLNNGDGGSSPALRWETTVNEFHYRGFCERAGVAFGRFVNNGFSNVSREKPAYLKFDLNHGSTLCETLVAPGSDPIYLALFLEEFGDGPTLNVPNDALSIVRWVAGESAVWLKLTASTENWIRDGLESLPPSVVHSVRFTLLGSTDNSHDASRDLFVENRANLPFNTRNLTTSGDRVDAVSTTLFIDASSSNFEPLPAPAEDSVLEMIPSAWDDTTAGVETAADPAQIIFRDGIFLFSEEIPLGRASRLFPDANAIVHLTTTVRDVFEDGTCERTGQMRFRIEGDVFPGAAENRPQYLRLRLSGGAVLCETRVDTVANQGQPISLALRVLENPEVHAELVAPPDTLQIVRWKANENEIWLKVTTPTSRWIRVNNSTSSPNTRDVVEFVLADSAVESFTRNSTAFSQGRANLAGNTLNPNNNGAFGDVIDTHLGMDLTSFVLPTPSFIEFNADSFDFQTVGVETAQIQNQIQLGDLVPLSLTGDLQIAQTQTDLPLRIDPEISVQGLEVITLDALLPDGVVPNAIRWENLETGAILSQDFSLAYDPLPGRTVSMRVLVTDNLGRVGEAFAVILVNPDGLDLNGDGQNTIEDLRQAARKWSSENKTEAKSVLDLLHIRIDPKK